MAKPGGGSSRGEGPAQAQLGTVPQCDALALSCPIQKGFEGAKCRLHLKVIEGFNLGKYRG